MSNTIHTLRRFLPVGSRVGRALLSSTLLIGVVQGQDVFVTISADTVDVDWQTATIADLPGPDGEVSFSEAMIATNNTPGHQTVGFAIPQSDWTLQFLFPGRAVLTSTTGFYYRANDAVTIDGTTQTAFTGDTNPDGGEVVMYGNELYLNADGSTLIGFDSTAVSVSGSSCRVEGNSGTMNISLFGGSGSLIKDNSGGTIKVDRSSDNVIVGNTVDRVRVWGFGSGQPATGNRIGGPALIDRNFITGYGTWNSDGYPSGTTIELFDTDGTQIENNWIGTTPDGLAQGNLASIIGIGTTGTNDDLLIKGNRIAGILGHGQGPHAHGQLFGWAILLAGSGSGIEIVGNTIGLDANDQPVLGSVWGIDVGNPVTHPWNGDDVRIGGALPGEGNVIAGHLTNGITVGRNAQQVRLLGNSIHDNGWLGIDLIPTGYGYGVTTNDAFDLDTGGNGLQNFPVLTSATIQGIAIRVQGALHSSPASDFTVEFFATPECDASGFGEGNTFLGAVAVTTDAAGDVDLDVLLNTTVPADWFVTATATLEPEGATSEFSACLAIADDTVGTPLCSGDGTGSTCPCGNDSTPGSGEGCANSTGVGAVLYAWGSAAAVDDELTLQVVQAPPGTASLFFQGGVASPSPFYDGIRCAGNPLIRLEVVFVDAHGTGSSTTSIVSKGAVMAGDSRVYQSWFRDLAGPCSSGGNISSALRIDWQ